MQNPYMEDFAYANLCLRQGTKVPIKFAGTGKGMVISDMSKSTVVIPNYNGIKYIEACLDSLISGSVKDLDVIVVDNASKDGSRELVRDKFPQVQMIENDSNTGFCTAVNQGIEAADTQYVILLNNDTCVDSDFVSELEKVMDNDKRLFSAGAKLISLYERNKTDDAGDFYCALGWAFARGKGKNPEKYNTDCDIFASCGGAVIYRKELLGRDKVGLFDENHFAYLEDIDIGYRAKIMGYRNRFASKAVVYHAGSATSGSRYNAFKTKLASKNSVYIIYKNMPLLQIIINSPFLLAGFLVKTLFFARKGLGMEYVSGLAEGVKLCISGKGKEKKQKFDVKKVKNYIMIQLELWRNLFLLITQ